MTRIIDNDELVFSEVLSEFLGEANNIDIAVGYFNLRGYRALCEAVEEKISGGAPVVRLLVGMAVNEQQLFIDSLKIRPSVSRFLSHGMDDQVQLTRRAAALSGFTEQLTVGLPTTKDYQVLEYLRSHVRTGKVQIKLYTERPLHGKAYVLHTDSVISPRLGFVGSSNLTLSGLNLNQELNVDVTDADGTEKLSAWFEKLWNNFWCVDVSEDILNILDSSWARETPLTPYEIYLKICFHLSQDAREATGLYELPIEFEDILLEYQKQAVQILARRIDRKGGALLGDVVGLGKTLTAAATAGMLQASDLRASTLVVCPPNLESMWSETLDHFKVHHRVVPYSRAKATLPDLSRFEFVIVDESHYFRNSKTEHYKALREYLRKNQCKVLLLSATPLNTKFKDIANQLGLYISDDEDMGFEPDAAFTKSPRAFSGFAGKMRTFGAFRKSKEPEDWARLLGDHLVRRTRTYIRKNFAATEGNKEYLTFANGEKFFFPERKSVVVNHSFGVDDPANLMASPQTLAAIDAFQLPRNNLVNYLNREKFTESADDKAFLEKVERARGNLIGISRSSFLKRLSSGGHPFILSLRRHLARNLAWMYALENGKNIPIGISSTRELDDFDSEDDSDDEGLDSEVREIGQSGENAYRIISQNSPPNVLWVRPELFSSSLFVALSADNQTISNLLASFGEWEFEADSKLGALHELITETHANEKILIFTEYRDTALYLKEAFTAFGVQKFEVVTSDTSNPTQIARRFSPESASTLGAKSELGSGELRILVTTDVLSEGQNLQDSHIVVNFDLPWSIIKLVQRAGRVDRVGQKSDEVIIYSFFHDEVEPVLNLRKAIRERLSNIALTIGNDERFLGDASETNAVEALAEGKVPEDDLDDVDAVSQAFEVWTRLLRDDPELAYKISQLPNLVDATRAFRDGDFADFVVYCRTNNGVNLFGIADFAAEEIDQIRPISEFEALRMFAAEVRTPGRPRQSEHFESARDITLNLAETSTSAFGKLDWVRKTLLDRLKADLHPKRAELMDMVRQRPLTSHAERILTSALRNGKSAEDLEALAAALHDSSNLLLGDKASDETIQLVVSLGVTHE